MLDAAILEMLARDASLEPLGIEVVLATEGRAVAEMTVTAQMANGHGICHGGIVFALADTAFACAANSVASDVATADAGITYLAPSRVGMRLRAEAKVTLRQGRHVIVDVEVRGDDHTVAVYRANGRALRP